MLNYHTNRNREKSFLWGTVRLPHERSESAFSCYMSTIDHGNLSTHLEFLEMLRGHQLQLLRQRNETLAELDGNLRHWSPVPMARSNNWVLHPLPPNSIVQEDPDRLAYYENVHKEVLQYYNFIAVTERWTESMAVLKLLLPKVQYSDVVSLRSKESGGYVSKCSGCTYIPKLPPKLGREVEEYLNGDFRQTNPDYLLYAAVNRSLDLTIELMRKRRVEEGGQGTQYLQNMANDKCQTVAILPYSDNGEM